MSNLKQFFKDTWKLFVGFFVLWGFMSWSCYKTVQLFKRPVVATVEYRSKDGVSYKWDVVEILSNKEIITRDGHRIKISDLDKREGR